MYVRSRAQGESSSRRSSLRQSISGTDETVSATEAASENPLLEPRPVPVTRSGKRRSSFPAERVHQENPDGASEYSQDSSARKKRATHRYSLRSSTRSQGRQGLSVAADIHPAASITPARINFDPAASAESDDVHIQQGTTNISSSASRVVNIYSSNTVSCRCRQLTQSQANILATSFNLTYGEEYIRLMREREMGQLEHHFSLKAEAASISTLITRAGGIPRGFRPSRAGTPVPGSVHASVSMQDFDPQIILVGDSDHLPRQPDILAKNRKVVVQWLSEVALEYKLSQFAYHLSISLVDAMLSAGPSPEDLDDLSDEDEDFFLLKRTDFQALACACLWIAGKLEDKEPPTQEKLSYISDHSVSVSKLRKMERTVCKQLKYQLHLVTPMHFVYGFLHASKACPNPTCSHVNPVLRNLTLYLLELSRASYPLTFVRPSLLAAAAIYLARATLGVRDPTAQGPGHENHYWSSTLEYHTGYSLTDLRESVLSLHMLHLCSESEGPCFVKYSDAIHHRVALKTVRPVTELGLS